MSHFRLTLALLLSAAAVFAQAQPFYRIETIAGAGNNVGDTGPALLALLRSPGGIATDSAGRIYIADTGQHRIRRVDAAGNITTIAGTGVRGVDGDDGLAIEANLWEPRAVLVNPDGSILIADGSARIRKVSLDGRITTIAGNGKGGWSGDGGPALEASIGITGGMALDVAGNLYISDVLRSLVRRVSPEGVMTTVAGTGAEGFTGDGGPAAKAQLFVPLGLAISNTGTLLIADYGNLRIRELLADGTIRTVAGGGELGDGKPATSAFVAYPCAVAAGPEGVLYVAESGSRIRKVDTAGIVTTLASHEAAAAGEPARALLSPYSEPCGLAMPKGSGALLVAERGTHQVTRIDPRATPPQATPVAGRLRQAGNRLAGRDAQFYLPSGLAFGPAGDLFFADAESHQVYRMDAAGGVTVAAGNGVPGFSGDKGPATAASLTAPSDVAVDRSGNIWIADSLNRRIRKVSTANTITTVASGEAADPKNRISVPVAIAVDSAGNAYFLELNQNWVRKIDPAGNLSLYAGSEEAGFSGDGGPAVNARFNRPIGLAVDDRDRVYIADTSNHSIRRVETGGIITTVAGRGRPGAVELGASGSELLNPVRVTVDSEGNLIIAEELNESFAGRIRRLDRAGTLSTIAGNGLNGVAGDGGLASVASLGSVRGMAADPVGNVYLADSGNRTIRKLSPLRATRLVIAGGDRQRGATQSRFAEPLAILALDEAGIPVPGVEVAFQVVSGAASLPAASSRTDLTGIALARLDTRAEAGPITVAATATGLGELHFELEAIPLPPAAKSEVRDYTITTVAGSASAAAASAVYFVEPMGVAFDARGEMYIADSGSNSVRQVSPNGGCATLAGSPVTGFCQPKETTAPQMALRSPAGASLGPDGSVYFADRLSHRILKVDSAGLQTVAAGTGAPGFSGDGGSAKEAQLTLPSAVLVDASGAILISDTGNRRVRKINPDGSIATVAGNGEIGGGGDGDFATRVPIVSPAGLALGADGVFFVADQGTHEVKAVSPEGILKIVAGTGRPPTANEEQQTTLPAALDTPSGLTVDEKGALYIGERGRVRRTSGDGPPVAIGAKVSGNVLWPAFNAGVLHILDTELGVVRRLEKDGSLTTVAGSRFQGDGGPALAASLSSADGIVIDQAGAVYFSDRQNHRVRKINPDGTVETIAGTGQPLSSGDGGPAIQANLDTPSALALHPDGSLYVAEYRGARIRRITPDGLINTVAGTGLFGNTGDGGPARAARFLAPAGLAIDQQGNVFVADYLANRVRRIAPYGIITTVAGSDRKDTTVEPGLRGNETALNAPSALALDAAGNLLIADKFNHRILKLFPSGAILRIAGNGQRRAGADGGLAVDTPLNRPSGVALSTSGEIYITDESNRITKVSLSGVVTAIAGRGPAGYGGDGGPALDATIGDPGAVAVDAAGAVYFSDRANHRIRKLVPAAAQP